MTKAELKQYVSREKELRHLEGIMLRLRAQMESPAISTFSDLPRGKKQTKDKIGDMIVRHRELVDRYNQLWLEKFNLQMEIEEAISSLEPSEQHLMRLRYLEGRSWEFICEALSYSQRQVFNLHGEALKTLSVPQKKSAVNCSS